MTRHSLPGYVADRGVASEPLAEKLGVLSQRIGEINAQEQVNREVVRLLGQRPAALRGGLVDRMAIDAIDDNSLVRRRPGSVCVIESQGDHCCCCWATAR